MGNKQDESLHWQGDYRVIEKNHNNGTLIISNQDTLQQLIGRQIICKDSVQTSQVKRLVKLKINCTSPFITRLIKYHSQLDKSYCSSGNKISVLFEKPGQTLRQEILSRKFASQKINEEEADIILEDGVKGIQVLRQMRHPHNNIASSSFFVDQNRKVILGDPWITPPIYTSQMNHNLCAYPSPEKILFQNDQIMQYCPYKSDLFSLGMVILETLNFEHMDCLYEKGFRRLIGRKVQQKINKIKNQELRTKIAILLSFEPRDRDEIYKFYRKPKGLGSQVKERTMKTVIENLKSDQESIQQKYNMPKYPQYKDNIPAGNYNPSFAINNKYGVDYKEPSKLPISSNKDTYSKPIVNFKQPTNRHQQFVYNKSSTVNGTVPGQKTYMSNPSKIITHNTTFDLFQTPNQVSVNKQLGLTTKYYSNNPISMQFGLNKQICGTFNNNYTSKYLGIDSKSKQSVISKQNNHFRNFNESSKIQNKIPIANSFSGQDLSFKFKRAISTENNQQDNKIVNHLPTKGFGLKHPVSSNAFKEQSINQKSQDSSRNVQEEVITSLHQKVRQDNNQYIKIYNENYENSPEQSKDIQQSSRTLTRSREKLMLKQGSSYQVSQGTRPNSLSIAAGPKSAQNNMSDAVFEEKQPDHLKQTPDRRPKKNFGSTIKEVSESELSNSKEEQEPAEYVQQQYEAGIYKGHKKNGMRNGYGSLLYREGSMYEGQWKNNTMHGKGKLYYASGNIAYDGQWNMDQFHGQGKVYNQDEVKLNAPFQYKDMSDMNDYWVSYEGSLYSDRRHGKGKLKFSNGQIFVGSFDKDMASGEGKFYTLKGQIIHGIWQDNIFMKLL